MKKNITLFMMLLAAVMMTGCSSDELGEFNANGDFVVKGNNPPSKTDFLRIVDGYGWLEDETHEVTRDGKWSSEDYWEERIGGSPSAYACSSGSTLFRHQSITTARCATMKPQARYISAITRLLP